MGIIRTDKWLMADFEQPGKICERLKPYFNGQTAQSIYRQLTNFGMYSPSGSSKRNLNRLVEQKAWDRVERLFQNYKNKWSGPDVPVFLFPIGQSGGFFIRREERQKGGVSFPDKMFLFLSDLEDPKEIEALLVHEYHHVCRLQALNKKMEEYTLLDSIVIEGLAEYAVLKNCGKEYLANWCRMYSENELSIFWDKYMKKQLRSKKDERIHDHLLYGGGRIPKLLGYAAGYNIVRAYYKRHQYSTKLSFTAPSLDFLE
ncbi:DUF2268 domain-containing protein [Neobacillus drentensis]|uniref:DUF2268 domain-containing protein n=1 Tax=Neobacillus drentensis TaxID=220684 RepID=UPI0030030618